MENNIQRDSWDINKDKNKNASREVRRNTSAKCVLQSPRGGLTRAIYILTTLSSLYSHCTDCHASYGSIEAVDAKSSVSGCRIHSIKTVFHQA